MACRDILDEAAKRMEHVRERLVRAWLGKEYDEVRRMTFVKRDPHFRIVLEAADAGSVTRARVNDDNRRLVGVDAVLPAFLVDFGDTQQRIIDWTLEATPVQQGLGFEVEQRRQPRPLVLQHVVGPLA